MTSQSTDALAAAEVWLTEGQAVALATVINTWGSAPQRSGSQLAVRDDGFFVGSVSGGCIESAVIEQAQAVLQDGKPRRLEFSVANEQAWSVGLACGGSIEIYVEPVQTPHAREMLTAILAARRRDCVIVRAVDIATGEFRLVDPLTDTSPFGVAAADAERRDQSLCVEIEARAWFFCLHTPPVDLVIVGAVHIAQTLIKMAMLLGYRVRVIDPRRTFAAPERFPGALLFHEYPDEALMHAPLTRRSALVALAHDPKIDDPALIAALASPAFYIGVLGSRKNQASRLERLKARGFSEEKLARIHGPVGLAIGAASPEEIALSIIAEITQTLRKSA
jgi:xanthine dehydrogenase accessory factor